MAAPPPRKGSILHTVKAVGWAFLGIRKDSEYQRDLQRLNPLHIVIVALLAVVLFVAALIGIVHWVVN